LDELFIARATTRYRETVRRPKRKNQQSVQK
jgi:hypothetical protein